MQKSGSRTGTPREQFRPCGLGKKGDDGDKACTYKIPHRVQVQQNPFLPQQCAPGTHRIRPAGSCLPKSRDPQTSLSQSGTGSGLKARPPDSVSLQVPGQLRRDTGWRGSRTWGGWGGVLGWPHQGPRSKLQGCQRQRPKTSLSESGCVYALCVLVKSCGVLELTPGHVTCDAGCSRAPASTCRY